MVSGAGPVQGLIERTVSGLGYELVDVEMAGRGLLRVFIDLPYAAYQEPRPADAPPLSVRVEDCEKVSHQLSHVLAVENIDYARLEVSSPGMDRPLTRPIDWERFAGETVALRLRVPMGNRRNFQGVLRHAEGQPEGGPARWALELDDPRAAGETVRVLTFTLDEVERARLVPRIKF